MRRWKEVFSSSFLFFFVRSISEKGDGPVSGI